MASTTDTALPTPTQRPQADVVIFDGKCVFCRKQVERLRAWDSQQRLAFVSLHDPFVAESYPDLSHEQLMEEMYLVDRQGRRFAGADAFRQIAWKLPRLYLLAPLLHLPFVQSIARWCYRKIAARRYRAGKLECDGDACKVHFPEA